MYKKPYYEKTSLVQNDTVEGERLETKIERITTNKEPITDGAPIIHTAREDGVMPDYDIRTDKWEHAVEAMDIVSKTELAKREAILEERKKALEEAKKDGEPESAEGTPQTGE